MGFFLLFIIDIHPAALWRSRCDAYLWEDAVRAKLDIHLVFPFLLHLKLMADMVFFNAYCIKWGKGERVYYIKPPEEILETELLGGGFCLYNPSYTGRVGTYFKVGFLSLSKVGPPWFGPPGHKLHLASKFKVDLSLPSLPLYPTLTPFLKSDLKSTFTPAPLIKDFIDTYSKLPRTEFQCFLNSLQKNLSTFY